MTPNLQNYLKLKAQHEANPSLTIFKQLEGLKSELNTILEAQISQMRDDFTKLIDKDISTVIERVGEVEKEQGPQGEQGEKGERGGKGDRGDTGPKGDAGDVGPQGMSGKDGLDGLSGKDGKSIVGPKGKDGKESSPDTGKVIARKLETLEGVERLDYYALKNLPSIPKKLKGGGKLGGGGGSGGLGTILTATGTIDDSNVTFTFTQLPSILIINGGMYQQTGGSITWTYLAGTVTLSVAVGVNGAIFGLA